MPIYSYRCGGCGDEFETLVTGSDQPVCPACGGADLQRLLSTPAIGGKTKAAVHSARRAAAREGHLSNFSRLEMKGK